uniref:Putative secreted protein n=1 Tax=Anopheles marajoara TaxID=58244 RepID=A0A2M4CEX2_9DIPT
MRRKMLRFYVSCAVAYLLPLLGPTRSLRSMDAKYAVDAIRGVWRKWKIWTTAISSLYVTWLSGRTYRT